MLVEFGQLSLLLAAGLALFSSVAGFLLAPNNDLARRSVVSMTVGQWVFVALAFGILVNAFIVNDFSVQYVASHSNTLLPWYYRISATWGGHEGSFLLWILIMCSWMVAVVLRRSNYPASLSTRVLAVLSTINLGFLCFLIFTSNPFDRLVPLPPLEGNDLNPLLQDFGLIVHPPLLYAGYVGLAVPFAFAIAALLEGKVDSTWARWSRPWTNIAWAFLTVGIALGSWWAYYELGWGGWWFWDAVENASFMPWLAATALIHSLAVTEKRGAFKAWTVLLAVVAFSLSLLGGFIVRSGVLTSVHSFAVDPERGTYILVFLMVVVGGSLALYALRAPSTQTSVSFSAFSREAFMLLNNCLLMFALAVVLWGTLAPICYEVLSGGQKISVGPPFFNRFFVPTMLIIACALAVLPFINWKRTSVAQVIKRGKFSLLFALGVGVPIWFLTSPKLLGVLSSVLLGLWIIGSLSYDIGYRLYRNSQITRSHLGMTLAHLGFAISILGVAITATQSIEQDIRLAPGQTTEIAGKTIRFEGVTRVQGPNYTAQRGTFSVIEGEQTALTLTPEKRIYMADGNPMTEAGIHAGWYADLYISLGEPLGQQNWAVRVHYKPLVRWVWLGALLMAFGGGLATLDRRYRKLHARSKAQPSNQHSHIPGSEYVA